MSRTSSQRIGTVVQVGRMRPSSSCRRASPLVIAATIFAVIPTEFEDLFHGNALAQLATLRGDGTPHLTPVWIDLEGGRVLVNTRADRVKAKHMQQRPDVAAAPTT